MSKIKLTLLLTAAFLAGDHIATQICNKKNTDEINRLQSKHSNDLTGIFRAGWDAATSHPSLMKSKLEELGFNVTYDPAQ